MKTVVKVFSFQAIFFLIASAYIPVSLLADAYVSQHRTGNCFIADGPPCGYDTTLASAIAGWTEYRNGSAVLNIIPDTASSLASWLADGRMESYLTDIFTIALGMLLLNMFFFALQRIKNARRLLHARNALDRD